jgi:hypothetical protein
MTTDDQIATLWRRVDPGSQTPSRADEASQFVLRAYSRDAVLFIDGDVLRLDVRRSHRFLIGFAVLFIPLLVAIIWFTATDPIRKWFHLFAGVAVSALGFTAIGALQRYHWKVGDYLVIDRVTKTLMLPRLKRTFAFAQVVGFQWVRERKLNADTSNVDLNLLAQDPAGDIVRYHVVGDPSRKMIEQVVCFAGLPLEEIDLR